MRFLTTIVITIAIAAGALWAGRSFAPCSPPMLSLANYGLPLAKDCPRATPVAAEAAPIQPEVEPPAVTVATATKRPFVDRLFVSGTLVAREESQVAVKIDLLTIVELDAEDGDHVEKGQVLARLDRTQLDAMLAENDAAIAHANATIDQAKSMITQAVSQMDFASNDYDRARKLGSGVMSTATVEQRETTMKTAQATAAAARNALAVAEADRRSRDAERQELQVRTGRTEVRAPVTGVVSRRYAKLGAMAAAAGEPLFRIIVDGAIDLEADVPEQSLPRLKVGMTAKLKLPGAEGKVDGVVRLVNQEVDKASRTGKVRISLKDSSQAHLGAFASGEVDVVSREGVGAPTSALRRDGDKGTLLVVKDGRVELRNVTPGIVEGDEVEIREGLAEGEGVVARAAAFLRPGDRVRPLAEIVGAGG